MKLYVREFNNIWVVLLIIMCFSLVTACGVKKYWYKPNSSQNEFNQDKYTCIQESAQAFPVVIQQQTYGTGYTDPAQTMCNTSNGQTFCTTIPGTYHPPITTSIDVNKDNRNSAFNSCMYAKGWYLKDKK